MANYNDTENSLLGTSYLQGVVDGFEDYIILPIGEDETVCIIGDITQDGVGSYSYSGREIHVNRSTSGYYSTYEVVSYEDTAGTITIDNQYYCRGNVGDLSAIATYRSDPASNFAIISLVWGVLFCFVLKSLLSRRSVRV